MSKIGADIQVALRIPGRWTDPGELLESLPKGFRLTPAGLIMPDGIVIEFLPMRSDQQFANIFRSSCRRPATFEETEIIDNYAVNACLSGPGGSLDAARTMMQAGAALIQAGGAGVFIDNSGLAHGGGDWIEMTEDGSPDALSFAFVSVVRGKIDVYTMGLHVLGLPDIVVRHSDLDGNGQEIIEMIRYLCDSETPVEEGHLLGDEYGPRFKAEATSDDAFSDESPMHNPFGRLRLVSFKDIAERN